MTRIHSAQVLEGYRVRFGFTDGTDREIDLEKYLRGPVFERIKADRTYFCALTVDPRAGTIVWPNGADIDPDVLYHDRAPAWEQEQGI